MAVLDRMPNHGYNSFAFTFSGYDRTPKEIFEIKDIRKWCEVLFKAVPGIFFYLSRDMETRQQFLLCISNVKKLNNPKPMMMEEVERLMAMGLPLPQVELLIALPKFVQTKIINDVVNKGVKYEMDEEINELLGWFHKTLTVVKK